MPEAFYNGEAATLDAGGIPALPNLNLEHREPYEQPLKDEPLNLNLQKMKPMLRATCLEDVVAFGTTATQS